MIEWLRRLFWPKDFVSTLECFERTPHADCVLRLDRRGQPGGTHSTMQVLWKDDGAALAGKPGGLGVSTLDIDKLQAILEAHGFWQMRNTVGTARDGVHYLISYADGGRRRCVQVWNPPDGSEHAALVHALQEYLEESN